MLNAEIVRFAAGKTDFYDACMSYFADKKNSSENKELLHKAYMSEVVRKSGVVFEEGSDLNAWLANPQVRWATMAINDAVINAILPVTILPQFSLFADFRTQSFGDVTHFRIMPNAFYTVSLGN